MCVNSYSNIIDGEEELVLVFIHGAGENPNCWNPIAENLVKKLKILVIERPGYGFSKEYPVSSINITIQIIKEVLSSYGSKKKYILVGHSLGGFCSLFLGRADGVIGRILISSFCRFRLLELELTTEKLYGNVVRGFYTGTSQKVIDEFYNSCVGSRRSMEADYKMTRYLVAPRNIENKNISDLIIHADEDQIISKRQSKLLKSKLSDCVEVSIENAGHNVIYEKPVEITNIILGFYGGISR